LNPQALDPRQGHEPGATPIASGPQDGAAAPGRGCAPAWLCALVHYANRVVLWLSMLAIIAACVVLTGSVVLRYFLHAPTDWQDEVAVFLLVFVTFGSGGWVQEMRGHIGIEAFAGYLPVRANRIRAWLCDAVSLAFCAFFAWKSWTLVHEAWTEGMTTSSTWAPPLWFPYSLMATGMSLLVLQLLLQVLAGPGTPERGA
jgi:TRAP-type C4-dicarboxylate transport system permease small subunit